MRGFDVIGLFPPSVKDIFNDIKGVFEDVLPARLAFLVFFLGRFWPVGLADGRGTDQFTVACLFLGQHLEVMQGCATAGAGQFVPVPARQHEGGPCPAIAAGGDFRGMRDDRLLFVVLGCI